MDLILRIVNLFKLYISARRWVIGFAIVLMVFTSIPYLLGFTFQNQDWIFSGFVFGVEDGNSYIAKMLSGSTGLWLFRSPYTSYPQNGVLAFLPYVLLGKLAASPNTHVQLISLFHIFRFASGILAILATYDFVTIFIQRNRLRRLAVIIASIGGGLGWIVPMLDLRQGQGFLPLSFYSPETFGFLALYGLPHLALGRAVLLWGLRSFWIPGSEKQRLSTVQSKKHRFFPQYKQDLSTGLYWLILGLIQPLTILIAWFVMCVYLIASGIWNIVQERKNKNQLVNEYKIIWKEKYYRTILSIIVSSPIVIYTAVKFYTDPYLKIWTSQNVITSPPVGDYLWAYGLLIPFAFMGGKLLISNKERFGWLPIAWALSIPILAYVPVNLQRRLLEGVWVALVILAVKAFERPYLFKLRLLILVTIPSSLFLVVGGIIAVSKPDQPLYRSRDEVKAFSFIAENANPGEIVLAAYDTGNALAAWAPIRVVVGHGPESAYLNELLPKVENFYKITTPEEERTIFLQEYSVSYVFWGPQERDLGDWDPHAYEILKSIFNHENYEVFEVDISMDNGFPISQD